MEFNSNSSLTMYNSIRTMCAAEKLVFSGISLICHATQPNKYMFIYLWFVSITARYCLVCQICKHLLTINQMKAIKYFI
jgi:hypothetical protein